MTERASEYQNSMVSKRAITATKPMTAQRASNAKKSKSA